jgi:hypothetical protein
MWQFAPESRMKGMGPTREMGGLRTVYAMGQTVAAEVSTEVKLEVQSMDACEVPFMVT